MGNDILFELLKKQAFKNIKTKEIFIICVTVYLRQ